MKQKFSLFATVFLALATQSFATVHTVSNRTPVPGQFNSIDAAITAATAGDTIYVHGSQANYYTATLNKRLTIIGTGHKVPNSDSLTSDLDYLYMQDGADGSKIIGMKMYYVHIQQSNIDSVTFERNSISYQFRFDGNLCDYWTIDGNLLSYTGACIQANNQDMDFFTIKNNVLNGYLENFNYSGNNVNLVIANNLFLHPTTAFSSWFRYAYIYNNIFYSADPQSGSQAGVAFSNNLKYTGTGTFPNGTNQTGVDPMFVNYDGGNFAYGDDYHLQPGSPAIAAGNDGLDLGVYVGNGHFNQTGTPAIPQVRSFTINGPTSVAPGSSININVISTIKQ